MSKSQRKKKQVFGKTLSTPVGRLVFPHIHAPEPFSEGQEAKFSANLVVKKDTPRLTLLIAEIEQTGVKAFGEAWTTDPKMYRPYQDGDAILAKIAENKEGGEVSEQTTALYSGKLRILAKGSGDKDAPQAYLADKTKLPRRPGNDQDIKAIEETFYAGCFATLGVTPYSFVMGANRGVALILKGIQFQKDGDRIGQADLDTVFEVGADEAEFFEDEVSAVFDEGDEGAEGEINVE